MTLAEYHLRMEAHYLQRVERDRIACEIAFMSQVAKSEKGTAEHPEPVYKHFSDLFNEQAQIDTVRESYEPDYSPIAKNKPDINKLFAKRIKEFHELKKAGKIPQLHKRKGVTVEHGEKLRK